MGSEALGLSSVTDTTLTHATALSGRPPKAGRKATGWLFVSPAVIIMLVIGLFPFFWSLYVSVLNLTGSNRVGDFIWLSNYQKLFADARVWAAFGRTLLILAVALPLELLFGLLLAMHFQVDRPFKRLFVALLVLPAVVSPMVAGSMWRLMFDHKFGPFNQIIGWIMGEPVVLLWVIKPHLAFWAILIAEVWQWTPFMFVILLAGLTAIPPNLYEAAELDGVGGWRAFWWITLPQLGPMIMLAITFRTLDAIRLFDTIFMMTGGGPGTNTYTSSFYLYTLGFTQFHLSEATAGAWMFLILTAVLITFLVRRLLKAEPT